MWSADIHRTWHVALQPGALTLARRRWGLRGAAPVEVESLPCGPGAAGAAPWEPVVQVLEAWLAGRPRSPRALRVVLSGHFVRWQLLPWSDALVRPDELAAHASLRLREVFGAVAEQWQVAYAVQAPGRSVVASGVDAALMERLRSVCAAAGTRLASATPYAAAACGHWRHAVGRQAAHFGVLEPGMLLLGLWRGGQWAGLHSERLPGDSARWSEVLQRVAWQQRLLAGEEAQALPLYLAGVGGPPADGAPVLPHTWLAPAWQARPEAARMALGI